MVSRRATSPFQCRMGTARRSSCRRRLQSICLTLAVGLLAYFGLLGVTESIQRSQAALFDACAEPPLGPIPRVLHQVFLDGEHAYQAEAADEKPAFRVEWRAACTQHYINWEYRFWTEVRALCYPASPPFPRPLPCTPSMTAVSPCYTTGR